MFCRPDDRRAGQLPEDDFKVFAKRAPDLGINQVSPSPCRVGSIIARIWAKRLLLKEVSPFPGISATRRLPARETTATGRISA